MQGLDVYADAEKFFDFGEAIDELWGNYIIKLKSLGVKTILDIGCGNGKFCKLAMQNGFEVFGIDLSGRMVELATEEGCKAKKIDLCDYQGEKFDSAVAIFDVLNYMDKEYLKKFLSCVENILKDGGYFLFDINSYFGFDEIAQGTIADGDENGYAILNSIFEDDKLITDVTLFEKGDNECFIKKNGSITQYYHSIENIVTVTNLNFFDKIELNLYSDEVDKYLIVLQKK